MRTQEKFDEVWLDLVWSINFHKRPMWLMALDDTYALSISRPISSKLAVGTVANQYDRGLNIIDSIVSSKENSYE